MWASCRLGEIANFRNGVNFDKNTAGTERPIVGVGDFGQAERLDSYDHLQRIALPDSICSEDFLSDGDLLFVRSNGNKKLIGRCLLVCEPPEPTVHSGFTIRATIDHSRARPEFLAAQMRGGVVKRALHIAGGGTNISNLSQQILGQLEVSLPPIEVQDQVLEVLTRWRKAVDACKGLIESYQQQKKALAQQLLTGKRRLPGFSGKWIKVHLGEVLTERTETNRLDRPLLSITSDRGVIPQSEVGRKDSSTEDKSKYKRIAPGDIGYNSMRMWQGVSALSELEGIVSPAYTIVTPREGIDAKFMSYLFKLPRTVHDFRRYSQGLTSDTWNLKYKQFREVSVRIPEFEEQQAIAKVFAMQDEVIAKLHANKEKLELEKRALMQQLLTGKRRVKLPPECTNPAKEHAS